MKTPTSNNKRKDNNVFYNTISDDKIKQIMNDAIIELKNIDVSDILRPLLANCAMELSDWIGIYALVITLPLLSSVSFMCVRASVFRQI